MPDPQLPATETPVLPRGEMEWWFTRHPASVPSARRVLRYFLAIWDTPGYRDAAELIVSELVTAAVRAGGAPIRLRLIRDEALTCEVADTVGGCPRLRDTAADEDEDGRAALLVSRLSRRWGTRPTGDGKVVWAEQDLPRPPAPG